MCVDFSVSICWRLHDHSMSGASGSASQWRPEVTREKREACSFKKLLGTVRLRRLGFSDERLFLSFTALGWALRAVIKVQRRIFGGMQQMAKLVLMMTDGGWFECVVIRIQHRWLQALPHLDPNHLCSHKTMDCVQLHSRIELKRNCHALGRWCHLLPESWVQRNHVGILLSRDPWSSAEQSLVVSQD